MAEAVFRHGAPRMINYTPSGGNVAAGEVVLIGNTTGLTCGIAHLDIVNNTLGALAVGDGVYSVVNLNNAANGTKVWWDNSANKVTTVSTNNALFGFITEDGGGGANTTCKALHKPYV
jgi:hypothetical protein